jgi:hypothetical protein
MYATLSVILFCSGCMVSGRQLDRRESSTGPIDRLRSVGTRVSATLTKVSQDTLPIFKAMNRELSREIRSDLPKITKELGDQMRHLVPQRQTRQ